MFLCEQCADFILLLKRLKNNVQNNKIYFTWCHITLQWFGLLKTAEFKFTLYPIVSNIIQKQRASCLKFTSLGGEVVMKSTLYPKEILNLVAQQNKEAHAGSQTCLDSWTMFITLTILLNGNGTKRTGRSFPSLENDDMEINGCFWVKWRTLQFICKSNSQWIRTAHQLISAVSFQVDITRGRVLLLKLESRQIKQNTCQNLPLWNKEQSLPGIFYCKCVN